MKKAIILCLLAIGTIVNAQNQIITKKLQLDNVPDGNNTEKILVIGTDKIVKKVDIPAPVNGSETKIQAGTNTTITGVGTPYSPYIINASGGSSSPVSESVPGIVDNKELQELGGVDKLINGIRIGRGNSNLFRNTAIGARALRSNTTGDFNTAVGFFVLEYNTTGKSNTGLGVGASYYNTTGSENTALGHQTLNFNTVGNGNTAIGFQSLVRNYADNNTGIGNYSLWRNTTGISNIAVGYSSGVGISSGSGNIIIGTSTTTSDYTKTITTGNNNLIIAPNGGIFNGIISGSGNIILGKADGLPAALENNIVIANGVGQIKAQNNGTNWTFTGQINKSALDTPPASATAPGVLGEMRITTTYIYVCTATNTWVRSSLTTW